MKRKKPTDLKKSYLAIKQNSKARIFPTNEKPNDVKLWEAHKKAMGVQVYP